MKNIKIFDRRAGFSLGALSILFGTMAPAVLPAFASADAQITSRSIAMSSTAVSAPNVSYTMTFTPNESTGTSVGVQFCSNTPLIPSTCTAPTGMDLGLSDGEVLTGGTVNTTHHGANFAVITTTLVSGTPKTIVLPTVTNTSTLGTFYAKILVFDDATDAGTVTADMVTPIDQSDSHLVDDGSVALSTANSVGVTAAVLESLTFCVMGDDNNGASGDANDAGYLAGLTDSTNGPTAGCVAGTNNTSSPSVTLGQNVGTGVTALETTAVSYAADWAQISTNASSGAVVYLRSNNSCAGLKRASASVCDIVSADAAGGGSIGSIAPGESKFGLHFGGTSSDGALSDLSGATGNVTVNPAYNGNTAGDLNYAMLDGTAGTSGKYVNAGKWDDQLPENTTSGSTYGGFVFGTASSDSAVSAAPAADLNVPFGLAASISNSTPAGLYAATLSLNAVGTF